MSKKKEQYIQELKKYVQQNIKNILKEPRSFIQYPFIDPGSVYDGNVWDWDTYWSVYGLLEIMDLFDEDMKQQILKHSKGNVQNFFDHQLEDGYIPMMIEVLEWPEPYLNTKHKEGVLMNMHKPFLCGQICLISEYMNDYEWVRGYIEPLERYFKCYDDNYYHENSKLYVWQDDIMIGMDNDPATFGRPPRSTANIFLNSFMVLELQHMQQILQQFGEEEKGKYYEQKATDLCAAIQEECWDNRDQFFYSVDVDIKTRDFDWFHIGLGVFWKTLPIKIRVWSGFIPLFANFASQEQAKSLVGHYQDEKTFKSPYGITTLAKDEKMFNLEVTNNPSNWLGPIWLVANYVVFHGLLNYGYREEAEEMCLNTLQLLGGDLEKTGSLHEYYDPFTGEPIMNGGFLNWNILVLTMVKELGWEEI
jgi:Glycogen debranching enzyme